MRRHIPFLITTTTVQRQCRQFATKYTAKVTSTSASGRTLSAEVYLPQPLPSDSRGYPIPRSHLICKATNIIRGSASALHDPFSDLSEYLSSLSLSLTSSEASEILKSLNCPRLALQFFHFCPKLSPDFHHDSFTYSRMILILSKSTLPNRVELVRSLVSQMEASNVRGTISTINILIGFFGDNEDLDMCIGLVKKWGLNFNSYTYKCLLQAFLRSRDSSKAFVLYMEMRRKGYKLDIFAYNMLLDALAKNEKHFNRLRRLARFLRT